MVVIVCPLYLNVEKTTVGGLSGLMYYSSNEDDPYITLKVMVSIFKEGNLGWGIVSDCVSRMMKSKTL